MVGITLIFIAAVVFMMGVMARSSGGQGWGPGLMYAFALYLSTALGAIGVLVLFAESVMFLMAGIGVLAYLL